MTIIYRLLGMFVFYACITGLAALVYRRSFPDLWPRARKVAFINSAMLVVGMAVWFLGFGIEVRALRYLGISLSALSLVTSTLVVMTMPAWGSLSVLLHLFEKRVERRFSTREEGPPVDESRRRLLRRAVGSVPTAAALTGPIGTAAALSSPLLREVEITVADLDPRLDGLTILQLTDVHLGTFIDNSQVDAVIDAAASAPPDLVVLTGDIADDYSKLPAALAKAASLKPRLGAWACIGNHEIYRGRADAEAIFAESDVELLCDEGRLLDVDGAGLWLCAADDPAKLGADHTTFLETSVGRACQERPPDVKASILLSHRPEGFEPAARRGVTLTLSGHTHGAQAAILGRSWLEWALPRNYLLGHYQAGASHLFTSAGLGHWFPFRLNCPCEAPRITLRRA